MATAYEIITELNKRNDFIKTYNQGDLIKINDNYANKQLRNTYHIVVRHEGIRPSCSVLLSNNLIVDIFCIDLISKHYDE